MQARVPILETFDIVLHHALGQVRIFAKGAVDARPARLGGQIRLRRQCLRDADGQVLLARDVAEAAHQRIVADGGQAQGFRPLRETFGAGAGAHRVLEMVARVRADGHGNAVARRFAQGLHLVVLGRHIGRVARHARDEGVDILLDDQVLQRRQVVCAALADAGGVGHGGRRAVHHQAGLFIKAHARQQVVRTRLGRQAPVFVRVDLAVAVHILEGIAIGLDQIEGGGAEYGLLVFLADGVVAASGQGKRGDAAGDQAGHRFQSAIHHYLQDCFCRYQGAAARPAKNNIA